MLKLVMQKLAMPKIQMPKLQILTKATARKAATTAAPRAVLAKVANRKISQIRKTFPIAACPPVTKLPPSVIR